MSGKDWHFSPNTAVARAHPVPRPGRAASTSEREVCPDVLRASRDGMERPDGTSNLSAESQSFCPAHSSYFVNICAWKTFYQLVLGYQPEATTVPCRGHAVASAFLVEEAQTWQGSCLPGGLACIIKCLILH